jgi:hypothetical protein
MRHRTNEMKVVADLTVTVQLDWPLAQRTLEKLQMTAYQTSDELLGELGQQVRQLDTRIDIQASADQSGEVVGLARTKNDQDPASSV